MQLPILCIKRPVFATVINLIIILLGLISFFLLPVRQYPNIDAPVITVLTTYRGASSAVVEKEITKLIEDAIAGISGIDYITSVSREEQSQITVNFKLNSDLNSSITDVIDRVNRVKQKLPAATDEPIIQKQEADAEPIIYIAFSSDRHTPMEVTDFANRLAKDKFQILDGVAEAMILGARVMSMRLWLDPSRLAAYNLEPNDIANALRQQNIEISSGRIESQQREFSLDTIASLNSVSQFENLIIKQTPQYLIRMKDLGRVELAPEDERTEVSFNGNPAIVIGIIKQATANPLDVSRAIRENLPAIQAAMPDGVKIFLAYDRSEFIENSIENVYHTILEACFLVILIIGLFLRSFRAILIPITTIPISLIGAFFIMYICGFSINIVTLLAMVLAIGLVVDDAIVVLENCHRHIEEGMPPMQAAIVGSSEIGFAIIAMTLTLAAVYLPVGFASGTTGKLFMEFAWVLAGSVLISGFVALTLSPMLCSRLLSKDESKFFIFAASEKLLNWTHRGYSRLLNFVLKIPLVIIGLLVVILVLNIILFKQLKSELSPVEDQNTIVAFFMAPEGSTLEYSRRYAKLMEDAYKSIPELQGYVSVIGFPVITQGVAFIKLVPLSERQRRQQYITFDLLMKLLNIPGVLAFATDLPSIGQSFGNKPVSVVLLSSRDYTELDQISQKILAEARKNPMFNNLDTDLKLNKPHIQISLDRDKISDLGLSVIQIGQAIEDFFSGRKITEFTQNNEKYNVIIQGQNIDRAKPEDLTKIYIRTPNGDMVPLSNLITFTETTAAKELNHFNQLRSVNISAQLNPGYTLGEGLDAMVNIINQNIPQDIQIDYLSESREFKNATNQLYMLFFLALIFIYLVLSAQFESFIDPLIILLSVPLATLGALLALSIPMFHGTLNIYSQVGLITLIGLITKHGILIIEFANQHMRQNHSALESIIFAAETRLRPILMTTLAMTFGALPLVLSAGVGAETKSQIGLVIVGGILIGTFFTLFVVPVIYLLSRSFSHPPFNKEEL